MIRHDRISLTVTNDSSEAIRVLWARATYMDTEGNDHKALVLMDTVTDPIEPGQNDYVAASPTAPFRDGLTEYRQIFDKPRLYRQRSGLMTEEERSGFCAQIGKEVGFRVPIMRDDQVSEYWMYFRINDLLVIDTLGTTRWRARPWSGCTGEQN